MKVVVGYGRVRWIDNLLYIPLNHIIFRNGRVGQGRAVQCNKKF